MVQWEASQCWSKRSTWSVPWWNFRRTSAEASMWTMKQATPCPRLNQTCLNVGGSSKRLRRFFIRLNKSSEPLNLPKPSPAQPILNWGQTRPNKNDRRPKERQAAARSPEAALLSWIDPGPGHIAQAPKATLWGIGVAFLPTESSHLAWCRKLRTA